MTSCPIRKKQASIPEQKLTLGSTGRRHPNEAKTLFRHLLSTRPFLFVGVQNLRPPRTSFALVT